MSERLVADPAAEAVGRVELDLTPFVGGAGPDWGDAAVEYYMAEASRGQIPVDFRLPNRVVRIPLTLRDHGELTFEQARSSVQAKAGLFQREGGILMREVNGTPWFADVVGATLRMGGSTAQALLDVDADAVLTLETLPDWYGEEIELDTDTGTGEVITTLGPVDGDHPGRTRIVITDTDGVARRGVLWAIRSRHYSNAATAAPAYAAEDLTPVDAAELATVAGSFGTQAVEHESVGENWTPVLSTDIDGVGAMTHTGSYRVWARAKATSADVRFRLAWDVGDLVSPAQNPAAKIPAASGFYDLDLGAVRLDRSPLGTHRWQGIIQAKSTNNHVVAIDRLWLQAVDDAAGSLIAPTGSADPGLREFVARDAFVQSAGNLNGKTAPVGGNWATTGDATDFAVDATDHAAERSVVSSGDYRYATLGGIPDTAAIRVDVACTTAEALSGLTARFTDSTNNIRCVYAPDGTLSLSVIVAGVNAIDVLSERVPFAFLPNMWITLTLAVDTDGRVSAWAFPRGGSALEPVLTVQVDELATGGALDSGRAGFMDFCPTTAVRSYDNFAAWEIDQDAVIHPNQTLEIRTDGAFRNTADGTSSGPVVPGGDLPRIPPSGMENRVSELLVKATRGDLGDLPDPSADDLSVTVYYRPSWLFVPQEHGS